MREFEGRGHLQVASLHGEVLGAVHCKVKLVNLEFDNVEARLGFQIRVLLGLGAGLLTLPQKFKHVLGPPRLKRMIPQPAGTFIEPCCACMSVSDQVIEGLSWLRSGFEFSGGDCSDDAEWLKFQVALRFPVHYLSQAHQPKLDISGFGFLFL